MVVMIKESLSAQWTPQKIMPTVQLTDWIFIVSVITLIAAGIVRKKLLRISDNVPPDNVEGNLGKIVQRYVSAVVISTAISEAVAFYGLIGYMVGADNIIFYTTIILSVAGMIYFRPRQEEIYSMIPPEILKD